MSPGELADIFAAIEREILPVTGRDDAFGVLTSLAVKEVPGAEAAGITRGRPNGPFRSLAVTQDYVAAVDEIQYELRSGPCVNAVLEGGVFRSDDLRLDEQWPEFGRRAFETTGTVSMLSFRLYVEDDHEMLAGLNMYSTRPHAFDAASDSVGMVMATAGALAMNAAAARERADNLEIALNTRTEIGIAIGVLMSQHKLTRDQAFDLLRVASQASHRKLAELAHEVAETGAIPNLTSGY